MTATRYAAGLRAVVNRPHAETSGLLRTACVLIPLLYGVALFAAAHTFQSTAAGTAAVAALAAYIVHGLLTWIRDAWEEPPIRNLATFGLTTAALTAWFALPAAIA